MRLYDQDGSTLIDSVNPNSSSSQTLTIYYEAPTDGTYYIKVNQDYSSPPITVPILATTL